MASKLTTEQWQARNRRIAAVAFKCALVLVCLPSIVYVPFAKQRRELLITASAVSFGFFLLMLISAILTFRRDGLRQIIKAIRDSWFVFLLAFLPSIFAYSVLVAFLDLQTWIATLSGTSLRATTTAALVLFLGATCFLLRLHARVLYGLAEVVVGVTVALRRIDISKIGQVATDPELALALLTASIYLIVRGFDNIHQGLTREPKDAISQVFWRWLLEVARVKLSPGSLPWFRLTLPPVHQ